MAVITHLQMGFSFSVNFGKDKKDYQPSIPAITTTATQVLTGQNTSYLYNSIANALARYFNDPKSAVNFCYHNIPAFTAPTNFLIKTTVNIPFVHEKKIGNDWKIVENSAILELFRKPNEFQTETEFFTYLLLNLICSGEVFVNKFIPVGFSKYSKLYTLPSSEMQIDWSNSTSKDYRIKAIEKYKYNLSEIMPDNMIWRKEIVSLTAPTERGVSRLYPLVNSGRALQAIAESTIKTIEDRGALGIIAPTDSNSVVMADDTKTIQSKLSEKYGITGDKSTVLVVTKPVTYTPMSFNVQELQLNETQLRLFRDVCMVLGIPSQLLGDTANTAYNNMTVMVRALYENSVIPLANWMLEMFEQGFNMPENERLTLDLSGIEALKVERQTQANIANTLYSGGIITSDEARTIVGLEADGRGYKINNESKTVPNGAK